LFSSLKLIETANELYNYIFIIDKYIAKIPDNKQANHEACKLKLENYKQKIINITTPIRTFINSQKYNINFINAQIKSKEAEKATQEATSKATPEATSKATPEATSKATSKATPEATSKATPEAIASENLKITLQLSLDPEKIIRKANKIIRKLNNIFILINNNSYPPLFIDYKNDILSEIHKFQKATKLP
jgi:hypothetical protein